VLPIFSLSLLPFPRPPSPLSPSKQTDGPTWTKATLTDVTPWEDNGKDGALCGKHKTQALCEKPPHDDDEDEDDDGDEDEHGDENGDENGDEAHSGGEKRRLWGGHHPHPKKKACCVWNAVPGVGLCMPIVNQSSACVQPKEGLCAGNKREGCDPPVGYSVYDEGVRPREASTHVARIVANRILGRCGNGSKAIEVLNATSIWDTFVMVRRG
jgi:hypothetical protein